MPGVRRRALKRAVGYRKHNVLSGLLIESAVIATLGVLVGSAVGIGMAWLFYMKFFEEAVFGVIDALALPVGSVRA